MSEDTLPENVFSSRIRAFGEALMQEHSERNCVIVGAAFLEAQLEDLLHGLCRDDKESRQFIEGWSFAAKIRAAFAFRLIPRELRERLERIKKIRNEFAHTLGPVSFQEPKCRGHLRILTDNFKVQPQSQLMKLASPADRDVLARTPPEIRDRVAFVLVIGNAADQMENIRSQVGAGVYPPAQEE